MWTVFKQDILQFIIKTHNFTRYLEIGTAKLGCFNAIECAYKVGCDPITVSEDSENRKLYAIMSDAFFKQNKDKFQIVFIDGLHHYEQLIQDIISSWNTLEPGGFIVCHDCLPGNEVMSRREPETPYSGWNGDCYRAIIWFRNTFPTIPYFVISTDWGLGLIYKDRKEDLPNDLSNILSYMDLDFQWLQNNLEQLNLIDVEAARAFITKI